MSKFQTEILKKNFKQKYGTWGFLLLWAPALGTLQSFLTQAAVAHIFIVAQPFKLSHTSFLYLLPL